MKLYELLDNIEFQNQYTIEYVNNHSERVEVDERMNKQKEVIGIYSEEDIIHIVIDMPEEYFMPDDF